jgi:hypothetical protein
MRNVDDVAAISHCEDSARIGVGLALKRLRAIHAQRIIPEPISAEGANGAAEWSLRNADLDDAECAVRMWLRARKVCWTGGG